MSRQSDVQKDAVLAKLGVRYGLVNRPAGIGCVPRGLQFTVEGRPDESDGHHALARHGILVSERTLTIGEVANFELAPLVDADGVAVVAALVVGKMGRYASEYLAVLDEDAEEFRRYVMDMANRAVDGVRLSIGDPEAMVKAVEQVLRTQVVETEAA